MNSNQPKPVPTAATMLPTRPRLKPGDRVVVLAGHPWETNSGTLLAYERYGLGWMGWRVELDGNCGECYANASQLRRTSR